MAKKNNRARIYRQSKPRSDRYQILSTTLSSATPSSGWVMAFPEPERFAELYKQCVNAKRRKKNLAEKQHVQPPIKVLQGAMRSMFDLRFIGNWRKNPWILCNEKLPQLQLRSVFRAWVDKCFVHIKDDPQGDIAWKTARELATSTDFDNLWNRGSDIRRSPAAIAEALIGQEFTVDEELLLSEIEGVSLPTSDQPGYRGYWVLGGPTNQENEIELISLPLLYHRYTYKSKKDNSTVEVDGYAAVSVKIAHHTHIGGIEYQTYDFSLKRFATQPVKYFDKTAWVLLRTNSHQTSGFQSAPLGFYKKNGQWIPRWKNSVPAVMQAAKFSLRLPSATDLCANPRQFMNLEGNSSTFLIPLRASDDHAWEVGIPMKEQRNLFREILRICTSAGLDLAVQNPYPVIQSYSGIARPPKLPGSLESNTPVPQKFLEHLLPENLLIEVYCRETGIIGNLLEQINNYIFAGRLEFSFQPVGDLINPLPKSASVSDKQQCMNERFTQRLGQKNHGSNYIGCLVEIDPKDKYEKKQDPKSYLQQIATRFGRLVKCFTWGINENANSNIPKLINTLTDLVLIDLLNMPPAYEHLDNPKLDKKGNPQPPTIYLPPPKKFVEVCLWIECFNRQTGLGGQSGKTAYAVAVLPDGKRVVYFPGINKNQWMNWQDAITQTGKPMPKFHLRHIEQILDAINNYFANQSVILTVKAAPTRNNWPWLQNKRYVHGQIQVPVEFKNGEWKEKQWLPKKCKLQIARIREPYEIGIGYALNPKCPADMNLDPKGKDMITDAIFQIPTAPKTPPTFISSAQKPQTSKAIAKSASKLGGMRIVISHETIIDEETQKQSKIQKVTLVDPEPRKRFAYPLPREICILWHSEDVPPALLAQHTHDSRYRMPHFPDATELPLSGALAKRLGDRIKMVVEAETEDDSEGEEELTE
ncbi:MAG: DUF3893 domain-containing protein [Chlorogloeopsis fritschii C42_A2020_084]|uniref:RNaseH domain-containing protein n=1 Tax=Chlorogloeopsis fritschii TaxID=1124 RepID=UPI0019F0FD94|nr:RNaseH domain-containing protein [Chlorogloeopsis fritschii]MBF2009623.1 DUF3893 domain-containing protein [Chlorogloeopsis fritschii C42_A2020_084]